MLEALDNPPATDAPPEGPPTHRPLVEVGWVLAGGFDKFQAKALRRARAAWARMMRDDFADFDWRVPAVRVAAAGEPGASSVEPVALIDLGVGERDARRWDFAVVFTAADLRTYDKPAALGMPSAAVACAVVSVSRLARPAKEDDPATPHDEREHDDSRALTRRIVALVSHLVGHLVGLTHCDDPRSFMHPPHGPGDLEGPDRYLDDERDKARRELHDIADPRLEEHAERGVAGVRSDSADPLAVRLRERTWRLGFTLRSAWRNRDDVWRATLRAQPWTFPTRLSRLTAAAASTLTVLLMTAESWEAGMSQPGWRVALLSLAALLGASAYLLRRQRLLIHPSRRRGSTRLSEARSSGNVAIALAVLLGMATTYAGLFAATLVAAWGLYPPAVAASWTGGSVAGPLGWGHYLCLAGWVATLGLTVGALGASFEPRGYVRHVAYVDEET